MRVVATADDTEVRFNGAVVATLNNGISPTEFDAGGFEFSQHTTNVDFSRFYQQWLRVVIVAAGAEYRR